MAQTIRTQNDAQRSLARTQSAIDKKLALLARLTDSLRTLQSRARRYADLANMTDEQHNERTEENRRRAQKAWTTRKNKPMVRRIVTTLNGD